MVESNSEAKSTRVLKILHFNDVYNIHKHASRFVTAMQEEGCLDDDKLVLFSGDLFSPSYLSISLRGE